MNAEAIIVGLAVIVTIISVTSAMIGIWQKSRSIQKEQDEITVIKKFDSIQIYGLTTQELEKIIRDVEEMKIKRSIPSPS